MWLETGNRKVVCFLMENKYNRGDYMFQVRDRQGGNVIDSFDSLEAATYALNEYEEADKLEGIYTENFYEIFNTINNEIIVI